MRLIGKREGGDSLATWAALLGSPGVGEAGRVARDAGAALSLGSRGVRCVVSY